MESGYKKLFMCNSIKKQNRAQIAFRLSLWRAAHLQIPQSYAHVEIDVGSGTQNASVCMD